MQANNENNNLIEQVNKKIDSVNNKLSSLIEFIKKEVFNNEPINYRELVTNSDYNVLGLCNYSNEHAILEMTSSFTKLNNIAFQIYIKQKDRVCYLLRINYFYDSEPDDLEEIKTDITISKITLSIRQEQSKHQRTELALKSNLAKRDIDLLKYINSKEKVSLKCKKCGYIWDGNYNSVKYGICICPNCESTNKNQNTKQKSDLQLYSSNKDSKTLDNTAKLLNNGKKFANKVNSRSNGLVMVEPNEYQGSKSIIKAKCKKCGAIWNSRADHLLERCWCPKCRAEQRLMQNRITDK